MKPAERLPSGLYVDSTRQDDRMQYRVLGVGPGRRRKNGSIRPVEVQAGDSVIIPQLQDSVTLSDGSLIANADQIVAKWTCD